MAVPVRQNLRMGGYLARQKLARREKFPLLVELEPLFACNLACVGCGKIQYPAHILKQRMSVEAAVAAVEAEMACDCGCGGTCGCQCCGKPGKDAGRPEVEELRAEVARLQAELAGRAPASG